MIEGTRPSAWDCSARAIRAIEPPPPEPRVLRRYFEVQGVTVCVEGDRPEVVDSIRLALTGLETKATPLPTDLHVPVTRTEPELHEHANDDSSAARCPSSAAGHGAWRCTG